MKKIILASTSPYRKILLQRWQIEFDCVAPDVDERAVPVQGLSPKEIALTLARKKTEAVFSKNPNATVIGSDQLVSIEGEILGKPGTPEGAIKQLQKLSGKKHELITAVHVMSGTQNLSHVNTTQLQLRALDLKEIQRYVQKDNPIDCAGSYKIEKLGSALLKSVQTEDPTSIEGMPLIALAEMLRQCGHPLP